MKKTVSVFLTFIFIFAMCASPLSSFAETVKTESTSSKTEKTSENKDGEKAAKPEKKLGAEAPYAILLDMKSGSVLYEKKASAKVYPASLTKIMTAVLALENGNLEDVVTASESAIISVPDGDSKMGIKKGERLSLRQLLYGMLLSSAADAANVVAEYTGGSIDGFVAMMNKRAAALGMKNTNFVNPVGDHDERHYTTPRDMSLLALHAMSIPEFCEIVKCDSYSIPATEKYHDSRTIVNGNHLVSRLRRGDYFYKYATGIKTGYTSKAKSCIAASAEKNGMQLLALVFGAKTVDGKTQSFTDCINMFNYVFDNYTSVTVAPKGEAVTQVKIKNARKTKAVLLETADSVRVLRDKNAKAAKVTYKDSLQTDVKAPVKAGTPLGTREYFIGAVSVGKVQLVSDSDYRFDPVAYAVNGMIAFVTSPWFILCVILLCVIFVMLERRRRRILRRKRRAARKRRTEQLASEIEQFSHYY